MKVSSVLVALVAVGIGATMAGNMSFEEIFSFTFLMALALGSYTMVQRLRLKATLASHSKGEEGAVERRLDELEKRLTDVLDVMLSVNDKLDRLDSLPLGKPDREGADELRRYQQTPLGGE